jgi:hypothetical protein
MTIKGVLLSTFGVLLLTAWKWARDSDPAPAKSTATPILVELFTSEGCSSCPPADRFLRKLDQQPVPGAEVVVLSEHVDYWNHIGWKDPYSAHSYSERQSAYSRRFDLDSVYTPQMVVDGASEFVGSNTAAADKALAKAKAVPKIAIHLSLISAAAQTVEAHVEAATLEPSFGVREAEVYIVLALNRAESQVSAGENAGRKLEHVAVVRNLTKVGIIKQSHSFSQNVQLHVEPGFDSRNLRLVAFVQEPRQGRVLGAALLPISTN